MTTQKIEVAHEPLVKQKFNWLLAIGIFIVGLGLGIFVTNLTTTTTEVSMQPVAEPAAPTYSRGPTLAEYTAAIEENKANVQGAIEAETARYGAMAKFYLTEDEVNTQRAIEAETAQSNGLVDGVKDGPGTLAWPPRPTQFHIPGVSLEENALDAYHQSERDFTPIVTSRIQENALDAYHQSEWGRALSPILPIVENKANADRDIGLMEFFTTVNGAGLQRHDREYGLAAFSTVPPEVKEANVPRSINEAGLARYHESEWGFAPNKADADQDIGLMEFFTVPDETSRQRTEPGTLEALPNIDPADRKFFSPGYGAMSGGSKEAEVLPNIDPADRKFFSPDYGAMSGGSKEAEVLPNIDPADRKFFSPGYGAQTTSAKRSEAILPTIENEFGKQIPIWFLLK